MDTAAPLPPELSPSTVAALLLHRVERTPGAAFLHWEGRTWSYREALRAASAFTALLPLQIEPSARIASFLPNCPEAVWTWLGAQLGGYCYVPLNRDQRGPVLLDMLRRAAPALLVTDRAGLAILLASGITHGACAWVLIDADPAGEGPATEDVTAFPRTLAGDALPQPPRIAPAGWLYTSGTTGRSKIVRVPQLQIVRGARLLVEALGLRSSDVFHAWLPHFHIAFQLHLATTMIAAGGSIALFRTFSVSQFWGQVRAVRATVFAGFGNVLHLLSRLPPCAEDRLHTLRIGLFSGVPAELHRALEVRFGVSILDSYDMTEASPITLPDIASPLGSCGRSSPDFELAIHRNDDAACEVGEVGEVCLRPRHPAVMFSGYESDDAATTHAWRNLWFHTGDLGRLDGAGYLYFSGRAKDVIRRRGENISASEIEAVVRTHEAVRDCACLAVPSELGEDDVKLIVVLDHARSVSARDLHAYCASQLARFAVPRFIELRASLPYSTIGKVDKESLRSSGSACWDAQDYGNR